MTQLHAWHAAAIRGDKPARHDGICHCGWYKRRLVRGGPWVPVKITVEQDIDRDTGELASPEVFRMEVEGIASDERPEDAFSWLTPITFREYERLLDARLRDPRMFTSRTTLDLSEAPTPPPGVVLHG